MKLTKIVEIIEEYFSVETKDSRVIPFILNRIQRQFIRAASKAKPPIRLIILKGRQFGFSTLLIAILFCKCMFVKNTRAVIVSHTDAATKKLFRRAKFFASTLIVRPDLDKESEREYSFPRTNSYFYIGTAGTKAFGRGDNLTDVHCSEVAHWEKPAVIMNGLMQAVGMTGNVTIETTANGVGNYFYKLWRKSYRNPVSAWTALFFKWTHFDEYEMDVLNDFKLTEVERDLKKRHSELNNRKIQWRRWKISETEAEPGYSPEQIFQREYPLTPREAFVSSGDAVFDLRALEAYKPKAVIKLEVPQSKNIVVPAFIFKPPSGYSVMGIDVAEGLENSDRSVIDIYDENLDQVLHWAGWCDTDELAEMAVEWGTRYKSYIVLEINNMGIAVLNILRKKYSVGLMYQREVLDQRSKTKVKKIGWRTTRLSKGRLVADLTNVVREHKIGFNAQETIDECMSFVKDGSGGWEADDGANDDRVIAAGLAVQGFLDRPPSRKFFNCDFTETDKIERLNKEWRAGKRRRAKRKRGLLKRIT